ECNQLLSIKFVLDNSKTILLGWGENGQKYLPNLLANEKMREAFKSNKNKCEIIKLNTTMQFPVHPRPVGIDKYKLDELGDNFELKNATEELEKWIKKSSI